MEDTVTVKIIQGNLRGRRTSTKSGGPLFSFTSIPYARPPVGQLRFKPPRSPESWSGTRDALNTAPVCLQEDLVFRDIVGQEDCLYLNVYTSQLPSGKSTLRKAVMVWIHGGGFTNGSGNPDFYGPDHLVDADVVLVTINYRLGVLGFLNLENETIPGNMGLKDQVAALQWVKENIEIFGGDPNNVTIFGESAGGASVHYLMLSPLSKGLFQKAIAQSGSVLNPWAFSLSNKPRALKLGERLGCKTTDPQELFNFLMTIDAVDLIKESVKLFPRSENISGLKFPFVPTVEPNLPGAFLCEHPLHAIRAGRFHKIPLIIGVTSHEGMITLRDLKEEKWAELNSKFQEQLPEKLSNISNSVPLPAVASGIRRFYFNNKPISADCISEFVDFQSDLNFVEGVYTTVKHTVALSSAPLYFYKFCFDGSLGFAKMFVNTDFKGSCHADDLGYLFTNSLLDVDVEPSSPEMKTIKRMITLWTNFAKSGNPTPYITKEVPVLWTQCTTKDFNCLNIDAEITMHKFADTKRMKFWEEMYKSKL